MLVFHSRVESREAHETPGLNTSNSTFKPTARSLTECSKDDFWGAKNIGLFRLGGRNIQTIVVLANPTLCLIFLFPRPDGQVF
jgi:hypothetical protein